MPIGIAAQLSYPERSNGRRQGCSTTGSMAVVRYRDAVDSVVRVSFDNRAVAVYGASTFVAHTGNGDTADRKSRGHDVDNPAAVAVGIIQADDGAHVCFRPR